MKFNYELDFAKIDFRKQPELYSIGSGEQGVLLVEPYKSEILPHWKFKTPEIARISADRIYELFLDYRKEADFVGMDMARKFLQMGYTRFSFREAPPTRRYANHKSGRKYDRHTQAVLPRTEDPIKAAAARIFYERWQQAKTDRQYLELKQKHLELT